MPSLSAMPIAKGNSTSILPWQAIRSMPSASVPRGLSFARLPLFGSFTQGLTNYLNFTNKEVDLNSLSYEDLLRKVSSINSENISLQNSINEISKENNLLTNSIVNNNNKKNSEYSKFLDLMQINLLHNKSDNKDNKEYTNNDFKKFLYKEKLFYGCLEEKDINLLMKATKENVLEWDDEKIREKNKLKQEILEKNLKNLYSNMFVAKTNKNNKELNLKSITKNKTNENIKKNIDSIINNSNNNKVNTTNEYKYNGLKMNNFIENRKESETNIFEDLIFNDDNKDDEDSEN